LPDDCGAGLAGIRIRGQSGLPPPHGHPGEPGLLKSASRIPPPDGAAMNKPLTEHPKLLLDPYGSWAAQEGVPIVEDFGVDLIVVPTAPWPRFGVDGAIVNLKGRGDFVSIFVLDLAPGAKTAPQRHL
jgi:hypothetical protein